MSGSCIKLPVYSNSHKNKALVTSDINYYCSTEHNKLGFGVFCTIVH